MATSEIVIASAKRTPVGSFNGAFGSTASDRAETRRIQRRIDAEFEILEPEDAL